MPARGARETGGFTVPDRVFKEAARLARRLRRSRRRFLRESAADRAGRNDPGAVPPAVGRIFAELGSRSDAFVAAARRMLARARR
jgi:hypothetical protein